MKRPSRRQREAQFRQFIRPAVQQYMAELEDFEGRFRDARLFYIKQVVAKVGHDQFGFNATDTFRLAGLTDA